LSGDNVLLISPTGSGKTEAALLPILEQIKLAKKGKGTKAIYVTPLRALNRDMLRRINQWAQHLELTVEVRHGDTPTNERRRQASHPPDILITTPETLQVLLIGKRLRSNMQSLGHIVIDEIHQLATDKRGSQLSFGLERLESLVNGPLQRIGLSATVANAETIANFLCGGRKNCRIVDMTKTQKLTEYKLEYAEPSIEDERHARELFVSPDKMGRLRRIMDLVQGHDRTIVFVNSRTVAEELGSRLSAMGLPVGVHHGSLPREEREKSEKAFKDGKLKALVSTSTLELGIDVGAVDLVVQYMSPRQSGSLIQRVGRAGHNLGRKSEGVVLAVSPEDVLESYSVLQEARLRNLEPVVIHNCPLDVLAHQIAGLLMEHGEIESSEVLAIAHRSYSFHTLTRNDLESVSHFMETLGYLRKSGESLVKKGKCREYYLQNLSTIRDERRYNVVDLTTQKRVGILGEEFMLLHAEIGLHFIIGGNAWKIESILDDNVYVTPTRDLDSAIPGWDGELIPISRLIAKRTGKERGKVESMISSGLTDLSEFEGVEKSARTLMIDEVMRQSKVSVVPTDRRMLVEHFKNYLIIHTSCGDRINMTLGELLEERLLRMGGLVRNWWSDGYRILIELSTEEFDTEELTQRMFFYDSKLPSFIEAVLRKHFPFGYEMKFVAERFGALRRGRLLSGEQMKELGTKFRFTPIYEETLREALATKVDITGTAEILRDLYNGAIELSRVETKDPSPIAAYILTRYAEPEDQIGTSNPSESMRTFAEKEIVSLLCFDCAAMREFVRVGDLSEEPKCEQCGSRLLSVLFYGGRFTRNALLKKKSKGSLTREEQDALTRARRSADIVISYGKKGIIAQSVYGVGPHMAARVLSRMHESDEDFYQDLLAAKLKFIETKQYWN
jgi:ATP-dependent Lhr-like helicase